MKVNNLIIFLSVLLCIPAACQQKCPCEAYDFVEPECYSYKSHHTCRSERKEIIAQGWRGIDIKEWPYIISLQIQVFDKGPGCYYHLCGGVLIAPNLVLSAAHCFDKNINRDGIPLLDVFAAHSPPCRHLASGRATEDGQVSDGQDRSQVLQVILSPEWNRETAVGDLAVCVLNQSLPEPYVKFTGRPFDPPTYEDSQRFPLTVAGWGAINPQEIPNKTQIQQNTYQYNMRRLHYDTVYYLNNSQCIHYLQEYDQYVGNSKNTSEFFDHDRMICAQPLDQKSDTCLGDSGSPLVSEGDWLDGIVSWGPLSECISLENIQAPRVFTRITACAGWIREMMQLYQN